MNCVKTQLRNKVLKITFQGHLEARNMGQVRSKILKALEKSPVKAVIQLQDYERLDFSFIQLLVALKSHLEKIKIGPSFNLNFSPEDRDLLDKLSLMNLLKTKTE